ncbi:MAG: DUF1269 domain-containing protein [Chloroflexi bacterium]|nr:DUF1269 domain-containing protein [Chloroflexota bacterium]MBP7045226.1 DUF1269 domain-containing protein [Chloroflexota bacterium]
MATITVLKFDTPEGAQEMLDLIQSLTKQNLISLQDAAIVAWEKGKKAPKTRQLANMVGLGALDGAFWGVLFGLIFFVPFFGMAIGAAMGALAGKFADFGIDDGFIKSVREKVTEGTSALFLMTSDAVMDKVIPAVKEKALSFELVTSNLSTAAEEELRSAFGIESAE